MVLELDTFYILVFGRRGLRPGPLSSYEESEPIGKVSLLSLPRLYISHIDIIGNLQTCWFW